MGHTHALSLHFLILKHMVPRDRLIMEYGIISLGSTFCKEVKGIRKRGHHAQRTRLALMLFNSYNDRTRGRKGLFWLIVQQSAAHHGGEGRAAARSSVVDGANQEGGKGMSVCLTGPARPQGGSSIS